MSNPLDSTYGVWLVSLLLETLLYGMGLLQIWIYFAGRPTDAASVKWTVLVVLVLETIQVIFFFRSSYSRFVEHFGEIQILLIWADSLQLLAAYLSAFTVQIYFASRILKRPDNLLGSLKFLVVEPLWIFKFLSYLKFR
ncbi:hypothetical protein C8R47DRAFT_1217491 [Mycena vitilis]|nr:hypothetical protein C8R47DRAFT_1217491 [Mycena vitilis]